MASGTSVWWPIASVATVEPGGAALISATVMPAVAPLVRLMFCGATSRPQRFSHSTPTARWRGNTTLGRNDSAALDGSASASQASACLSISRCIGSQTGFRIDRSITSPSRSGR